MKKIDVYTLGQHGINRVKSPVHVQDGELLSAQNATVRPVQGQLAITKRDGMSKINSTAANGVVNAVINVPIIGFGGANAYCTTTAENNWKAGAWSPELGLFAVVGSAGTGNRIMTSPDGQTWTLRSFATDVFWRDITWSSTLGIFAAVGNSQTAMTSADGITWTARTMSTNSAWWGIAWSPTLNLFVAVGAQVAASSPDGITWTDRTAGFITGRSWRKVTWSPGLALFVAVASTSPVTNNVMTSPDGINWTQRDPALTSGWNDIAWSEDVDVLVAVGGPHTGPTTDYVMYSTDGTTWTASDYPSNFVGQGVAWSPELGIFLAAGIGDLVAISADGINWNNLTTNCGNAQILDVVYAPALEKFLLVSDSATELMGNG